MIKQNKHKKQGRKIIKCFSIFIGMVVLVILSSITGEGGLAEQADANSGDNVVAEPKEETIVVPFWDTEKNIRYESVEGTLVFMDNSKEYSIQNVYNIQMEKDGLLCLAVLVKKMDISYEAEIELKDVNGKHIKDLDYIKEGEKIKGENLPPIYLKAGIYKLEVKYFDTNYDEDYYEDEEDDEDEEEEESDEDFEEESTDEDNGKKETTSKKYVLEYEIRCSAVKEDVSSNWNLKKTKFCASKDKKMYYKKINIKKDGVLKVYTQTIDESVLWEFLLGKKIDEEDWGTSITLCDKNKKEKGGAEFVAVNKKPAVFAVKKGTYYLKIEGANQWYRMWSKFKAMHCGAKTKKKAVKVTNKYKSYLLPVFEKSSDGVMWFKFMVRKPKIMYFYMKFVGEGNIDFTIYKGKKEYGWGYLDNGSYGDNETSCSPNRGINAIPWEKGTYYVKVKKKDIKTHGNVQIKIR